MPLSDGRVLVTGRDLELAVPRRAFLVDPNRPSVEPADATRVPSQLLALEGGVIAELDASGASLHRELLQSPYDDAPAGLLTQDDLGVALDLRERWLLDAEGLAAQADARFDLPGLRFAAVAVELELSGEGALLLAPQGATGVAIEIDSDAKHALLAGCELALEPGAPLRVTRHATGIELQSGEQRAHCSAPQLLGDVAIAVRLRAGGRVTMMTVERR